MNLRHLLTFVFLTACAIATAQTSEAVLGNGSSDPAVLFDGKEISREDLATFSAEQIGDIKILSGAEAEAQFGKYGTNGAIVVTSAGAAPATDALFGAEDAAAAPAAPSEERVVAAADFAGYIQIDGRDATNEQLRALDPAQIESVSVFKGSEAQVRFGSKAAEGAMVVKTKQ